MLSDVLNELSTKRTELENFIKELSEEELLYSSESSWSISEIVEHLYLTEVRITKGIVFYASQPEEQQIEEKPIHYLLNRSRKIEAPKHVWPTGKQQSKNQHLSNLERSRKSLLEELNKIDPSSLKSHSFPHAFFGPLSLYQWIELVGLHEKRHILQMRKILKYKQNENLSK